MADVIPGVTLRLKTAKPGETVQIDVSRDDEAMNAKLQGFKIKKADGDVSNDETELNGLTLVAKFTVRLKGKDRKGKFEANFEY